MRGQLARTAEAVPLDKTLSTRAKSPLASIHIKANDFSAMFNRNSATPEIIKQAAERKKISLGAAFHELSANCRQLGN